MRSPRLLALAVLVVASNAAPAGAARNPVTVLLATVVTDTAPKTMTPELWQQIVNDDIDASKFVAFKGIGTPSLGDCRAAGAAIAIVATFDGAARLPGIAADPERTYGIARFDRLNCLNGETMPPRIVRVSSDPPAENGDREKGAPIWNHTIRAELARDGLPLTGIARIVRIERTNAYIDAPGMSFAPGQVLQAFVDRDGKPRTRVDLVVGALAGKLIVASFDRKSSAPPRVGDFIEAAR